MTPAYAATLALILAVALKASRSVSTSGAVAGAALAFIFGCAPTTSPLSAFAAFVLLGTVSSRIGRRRKEKLGVYQNEKGPRTWEHALANCGVGAVCMSLGLLAPDLCSAKTASLLACCSLGAVCADTMASEWGTWLGGTPRNILTFKTMPPGADGAVTWTGTAAGLLGATVIGILVVLDRDLVEILPGTNVLLAVLTAGAVGNLADSMLGATVERHLGAHGGSWVNLACSLTGAGAGLVFLTIS